MRLKEAVMKEKINGGIETIIAIIIITALVIIV